MDLQICTPEFTAGACYGMPNDEYHSNKAISLSKLKLFLESPRLFQGKYITDEMPTVESDALRRGSAQHVYTLEGLDAFNGEFCVIGDLPFRSKDDKAASICYLNDILDDPLPQDKLADLIKMKKDEVFGFFSSLPGKTRVTRDELDTIRKVDKAVKAHPIARDLLAMGIPEVSFRSEYNKSAGFAIQCRTDWLNVLGCETSEGEGYLVDLKTVASMDRWDKNYFNLGYWMQWPFYCETMKAAVGEYPAKRMYYIVAETSWPHRVIVRMPNPDERDMAMSEIERGFQGLTHSIQHDDWNEPGWDQLQIQTLDGWAERVVSKKTDRHIIDDGSQPSLSE